jgi:hypothetical protein
VSNLDDSERKRRAALVTEMAARVDCPTCTAHAMYPCSTRDGKPRRHHKARRVRVAMWLAARGWHTSRYPEPV